MEAKTKSKRKKRPEQFKVEAVRLLERRGKPDLAACRNRTPRRKEEERSRWLQRIKETMDPVMG